MTTRHYVALRKVDLGSEFLRFLGPNRGWVVAVWKWLFPVFQASVYISTYLHIYMYLQTGTVHYLPHTEHSDEVQLPGLDEPVPDTWKTVQVGDGTKCTCDVAKSHL